MIAVVLDIVSRMCTQFNVIVGAETLRDYVIPSLENTSSDEIIRHLRSAGITIASAASALVHYRLNMNLIAEAARIGKTGNNFYPIQCSIKFIILSGFCCLLSPVCPMPIVDSLCFLINVIWESTVIVNKIYLEMLMDLHIVNPAEVGFGIPSDCLHIHIDVSLTGT
jgi:hypothetical protein